MTMYTPPCSSTANEFEIVSPVSRTRTVSSSRPTVPTMPDFATNHSRPAQSGSTETILSSAASEPLRSTSRVTRKPGSGVCSTTRGGGRWWRGRPVVLVEVEVAAAGEVLERVAAAGLARRERQRGERRQRDRVLEDEHRPVEPDADRDDPVARVERHRRAVAHLEDVAARRAAAERARALVRVGHVRVVVDVRAAVRREERVLRRERRGVDRLRVGGRADERGLVVHPLGDRAAARGRRRAPARATARRRRARRAQAHHAARV